jgi:hypothetical protein
MRRAEESKTWCEFVQLRPAAKSGHVVAACQLEKGVVQDAVAVLRMDRLNPSPR